ncbi:MAG: hypothetical protein LCH54_11025 [Bacteroidetes bacterium]|nr:hypothetical protein [Bacteroidota bacterium]
MNLIILLILFVANENGNRDDWFPPYCKMSPKKIAAPKTIQDCITQLDTVLTVEVKEHFRKQNEQIASIEIMKTIGEDFVITWQLDFYSGSGGYGFSSKSKSEDLLNALKIVGVKHHHLILKIVFNCLYKKLNEIPFDINIEVQNVKNEYDPLLVREGLGNFYQSDLNIEAFEDSIITSFRFKDLGIGDTVGTCYHEKVRNSLFYLTGVIDSINYVDQKILVRTIDISSNLRYRNVLINKRSLVSGDTITVRFGDWYKKNEYEFDYNYSKKQVMPEWQRYLKQKFGN